MINLKEIKNNKLVYAKFLDFIDEYRRNNALPIRDDMTLSFYQGGMYNETRFVELTMDMFWGICQKFFAENKCYLLLDCSWYDQLNKNIFHWGYQIYGYYFEAHNFDHLNRAPKPEELITDLDEMRMMCIERAFKELEFVLNKR